VYLQNARIILDDSEVILHSADSIASVGILHPRAFHLEHKLDSYDRIEDGPVTQESSSCLYEVDEVITHTDVEEKQSPSPAVDACANIDLCISKTGKNLRSIGCWIQDPSRASEGAYCHHILFHCFFAPRDRNTSLHLLFSFFVDHTFNNLLH
jgi:diphthine-ammonia ligase